MDIKQLTIQLAIEYIVAKQAGKLDGEERQVFLQLIKATAFPKMVYQGSGAIRPEDCIHDWQDQNGLGFYRCAKCKCNVFTTLPEQGKGDLPKCGIPK